MAGKIFINYRRDDSIGTAGRLHDRLAQAFGRNNLFMDVDHIPAGVDFVEYLHSQVAACDVFLAVIGPNWLDAKDDSGRRRFDNPDDFVTVEIAAALARNIRVIPVLVDGARTPKADKLPDSVKPLVRRNAVQVRNTNFGRDAEALANKVREALKSARPVTGRWSFMASLAAWLMVAGQWRIVAGSATALLLVGWIGLYQMGVPVWVPWTPGAEQPDSPRAGKAKAAADAEARRKAEEAEQQRLKEEEQRQAKAASDAEAKRKAAEAEQQRLKEEEQRQAKAASDAEAKRKAAEAEQQRLAAIKEEEQRQAKAADVEAKLKAAEAEQQRLKEEVQRQAKAAADAEAKRKAAEAEQQRLKEEVQRQAKAAADAEAKRRAAEVEQQRLAAVKSEEERRAKADTNAKSATLPQSGSTDSFERRSNMRATGPEVGYAVVNLIGDCEQRCTQSASCTVFMFDKRNSSCFLYSRANFAPDENYDSGIRKSDSGITSVPPASFERRRNMRATGPEVGYAVVNLIGDCEQRCTQSASCTVFMFDKRNSSCFLYSRANFAPDENYDSGIRK
jgi:TIR domain/PAN domain